MIAGCLLFVAATAQADTRDPNPGPYAQALSRQGFAPTGQGGLELLARLAPVDQQGEQVALWIGQLGDRDFFLREAAMRRLADLPVLPLAPLQLAAESDDAETRWRARRLLDNGQAATSQLLLAALTVIAGDPLPQAVEPVLRIVPLCRQSHLVAAAHQALLACSDTSDLPRLRRALASSTTSIRIAAAVVMAQLLEPDQVNELYPLLTNNDEPLALGVAQALGDIGDRQALPALVRLLDAEDRQVRADSAAMLQGLSGRQFGYAAYDLPTKRAASVAAWQRWIADESATANLRFPAPRDTSGRGELRGNTLISTGTLGRVAELTPTGETAWEYELAAWSAEKLPSGNVLIASYNSNRIVEVDQAGATIWQYPDQGAELPRINPMTAKPLAGGNILVADFTGRQVVEINRAGRVVWKHDAGYDCFDADRLPNGNTIFGCPNLVREVTPDHRVVREWTIEGRLNGFHALADGRLLVANYGQNKIQQLSPEGEVMWELNESQPCDVFQLPDGALLVSTATRIIQISPDRQEVRELSKAKYGSARR